MAVEVARASGEVDGVRLPKEAYYVCRTMFRDDPQVHIIGHWTYPAGTKKTVYVASNGEEVELFVNGKSLGQGKVSDRYLFTFPDVAWEAGEIKAVAYAGGKPVATQIKHTVGPPVALRLTPITGPGGLHADGSDIALIDVEAVDANGDRCPTFQQRVDFETGRPRRLARRLQQRQDQLHQQYLPRPGMRHQPRCGSGHARGRRHHRAGRRARASRPASVTIPSTPVKVENGFSTALPVLPAVDLANPRPAEVSRLIAQQPVQPRAGRAAGQIHQGLLLFRPHQRRSCGAGRPNGKKLYVDAGALMPALPAALGAPITFRLPTPINSIARSISWRSP